MNAEQLWREVAGENLLAGPACAPPAAAKSPLDLAIVAVRGADAQAFLHAQFAADLRTLGADQAVLTAWCSPQGRVLFAPEVLASEDGFLLLVDRVQAADLVRRLRLYVLRAQVSVDALDEAWAGIRVSGPDPAVAATGLVSAADGEVRWYLGPQDLVATAWAGLAAPAVSPATARLDDIRRGRPRLGAATADRFLPQELDLDQGRGVSFDKGCYPGQEIVARVRYRGNVKRRLAHLACAAALATGDRLVEPAGDTPRGTVIDAVSLADGWECLAVLDAEAGEIAAAAHPATPCRRLAPASTALAD
ncbi:MAG: folate-binding protein YgfZ [Gammaproteobacteria bacterium]|nr:folate-binding protein YgfZ [Gammaproteobacteria bacterium]